MTVLAVQPLVAVSFCLWYIGQSRMLSEAVPADRQASAQTLGSALSGGVASLLAGVAGGQLANAVGYGGLFGALAAISLAGSAIGCVVLVRRRRVGRQASARWLRPATPGGSVRRQ